MEFSAYFKSLDPAQRQKLAEETGTTVLYLRNIAYGSRKASDSLALAIVRVAQGAVALEEIRPGLAEQLEAAGYVRAEVLGEAA